MVCRVSVFAFRIYNTLTRKVEVFEPLNPPFVRMYFCGMTPQDKPHIGHMRAFVAFDVLRRTLEKIGYITIFVTNFTDIDDKIIRKSQETGKNWREIAEENIREFLWAFRELNCLEPIVYPKVTEHIEEIISFVKRLVEKGYAYESNGSVYYEVDKYPYYGQLSRAPKGQWAQETDVIAEKKKPYDFALWKRRKEGEPYWESPWGPGRPGWHIECSTMSIKYLGEQFDIHGGGTDLIFPHHENEIAQSEAYTGKRPWVKYWFHVGLLLVRGEKMSKSLGNFVTAREAIEKYGPMALRFYLLRTHYRKPFDFHWEHLEESKRAVDSIAGTIKTLQSIVETGSETYKLSDKELSIVRNIFEKQKQFMDAMMDDLNTSKATSHLFELVHIINSEVIPLDKKGPAAAALYALRNINDIYACWDDVLYGKREESLTVQLIELLLEVRKELRKMKMFELSDKIRSRLRELGIDVMDSGLESTWRFCR